MTSPAASRMTDLTAGRTSAVARVYVAPAGATVASSRILLDGVRMVAEGSSPAPGEPAVRAATTSGTPEKWPAKHS